MGWAAHAIAQLQAGESAVIRPRGHSMSGKVEDSDTVHVEPLGARVLQPDDIVLCKVRGRQYLHLIKAVRRTPYLIGNNRSGTNGWISRASIYGIATQIGGRQTHR